MKHPLLLLLLAALALLCACAAPAASDSAPAETQPEAAAPQQYTLSFVGDCTLASSQFHRGSPYSFRAVIGDELARPFAGTAAYFQDDSLTVANLECTLTDSTAAPRGLFGFAADPAYVGVLTAGGVDMVTLANNHSGDFGPDAYAQTGRTLDAAGIDWAGEDEWTLVTTADGLTVGLYCTGASLSPAVEPCLAALEDMRAAGAELCVVLPHWGKEGAYRPNAAQRAFAEAAAAGGADLIIGSHPHVLQPIEECGGALVAYSLGNYVFGGNTNPRDHDTVILQVTYTRQADGTLARTDAARIPCSLSGTPGRNDYSPVPYDGDSPEAARALSKLDGSFTGPDLIVDYTPYLRPAEPDTSDEPDKPDAPDEPDTPDAPDEPSGPAAPDTPAPPDESAGSAQPDAPTRPDSPEPAAPDSPDTPPGTSSETPQSPAPAGPAGGGDAA